MEDATSGLTKAIAEQGILFAVLVAILLTSYRRVWCWYYRVDEVRAEYEARLVIAAERLEEARRDKQWWQTQATQALGIAEGTVQTLKSAPERRSPGGGS